ncbi:hypothetical protein D9M68_596630 [compost metagenome]
MMVASWSGAALGLSWIGLQACRSAQLNSNSPAGWIGRATVGTPLGMPSAMAGQSSSLPMKASIDSECSSTWRTDSAVRLG